MQICIIKENNFGEKSLHGIQFMNEADHEKHCSLIYSERKTLLNN